MEFTMDKGHAVPDNFVLVEVSSLSIYDDFMDYHPRNEVERECMKLIEEVIALGIKDFYRPRFDPSFDSNGGGICFNSGCKPITGKTYNWWVATAKQFSPLWNSRLGTKMEYMGFIAVLLKKMVARGWSRKTAWNAVCDNSKWLGHYCDSYYARSHLELTGTRGVCGFFDLANTYKILASDKEGEPFYLASGDYHENGEYNPISALGSSIFYDSHLNYGTGWVILETK